MQRRLREMPGVTVLIYEQTCAAEKRRRRKKGELVDPARRLFINERVCEGCGDCSVQSNCVAVLPLETPLGRKRKIDQSSCNKDYSCAKGFCPSFVGVLGGAPRKRAGALAGGATTSCAAWPRCPCRRRTPGPRPYDLLVTGVGGTGVVTVGRADRDGRAPGRQERQRAGLHGLRAEGRLGAVLRAPGRRARRA